MREHFWRTNGKHAGMVNRDSMRGARVHVKQKQKVLQEEIKFYEIMRITFEINLRFVVNEIDSICDFFFIILLILGPSYG